MSGIPMRYPVSNFTSHFFGIGGTSNDRVVALIVVEHEITPSFLFTRKTVRIEPATSLFMISHPAVDAIVRK